MVHMDLPFLPDWAYWFLLGGIGLVVVAVPVRILWKATRGRRAYSTRLDHLAVRLRETFSEVVVRRPLLSAATVDFKFERRKVSMVVKSAKHLILTIDEEPDVPLAVVLRSARWMKILSVMEGWEVLSPVPTGDPMLDMDVELYANGIFAGFLRDKILGETPMEGPPTGLAESLIIIKGTPGVKKFYLRFSPRTGTTLDLRLSTEDLFYRSEDLESLLHHVHVFHDFIVNYDRPGLPPRASDPPKGRKPKVDPKELSGRWDEEDDKPLEDPKL